MITKTTLLLIIGGCAVVTAVQVAWEMWRDHAARKAALVKDMESMDRRRKRELMMHNRRQLWLEYVNREEDTDGVA